MKHVFSLVIALTLVAPAIFATGTAESSDDGRPTSYTAMVVADPNVADYSETALAQFREEQTGIAIEFDVVPNYEGVTLAFASGDLPDLTLGYAAISPTIEQRWASQGILVSLDEMLPTYGPNFRKILDDFPAMEQAITLPDGHIYQFPNIAQNNHGYLGHKGWIYRPWLEQLGLEVPRTTEELREVLFAFKTGDPNGNGRADEIPMTGATGTWNARPDNFIMNAFVEYNAQANWLLVRNGRVLSAATLPEFRDGIAYMNELYEEGLIDPAAFTQDLGQLGQLAENAPANIVGMYAAGHLAMAWGLQGRAMDAVPLMPLEGPDRRAMTPFWGIFVDDAPTMALASWNAAVITREAEQPEVLVEWLDWFYTREGSMWQTAGEEGVHWQQAASDQIGMLGQPASWTRMEQEQYVEGGRVQTVSFGAPAFADGYVRLGEAQTPDAYEVLLTRVTQSYEPYVSDESLPQALYFPLAASDELAQLTTVMRSFLDESIVRFITGDRDIDAEWNTFQTELANLGLSRWLAIHQTAYDAQY